MGQRRFRWLLLSGAAAGLFCAASVHALNTQRLDPAEADTLQAILRKLEPLIAVKKQDGTANILTWEELYGPLSPDERALLDAFRRLKAAALGATSHYFGEVSGAVDLVPVGPQSIVQGGEVKPLDPQFLPRAAFEAYERMMAAMERDVGKRLRVESGYRCPAYQLYLFLFYLPKHGSSIVETNRFVALPGHSEHGHPPRQAVDFINAEGINGEDHPEEFEALPEYRWLQQHAKRFGFALSYPRDNPHNTSFEPWHWHHEGEAR